MRDDLGRWNHYDDCVDDDRFLRDVSFDCMLHYFYNGAATELTERFADQIVAAGDPRAVFKVDGMTLTRRVDDQLDAEGRSCVAFKIEHNAVRYFQCFGAQPVPRSLDGEGTLRERIKAEPRRRDQKARFERMSQLFNVTRYAAQLKDKVRVLRSLVGPQDADLVNDAISTAMGLFSHRAIVMQSLETADKNSRNVKARKDRLTDHERDAARAELTRLMERDGMTASSAAKRVVGLLGTGKCPGVSRSIAVTADQVRRWV